MNAVITNAASAVPGGPPNSSATAPAWPAQPSVAAQRGYGCGAPTAPANAAAAAYTPIRSRSTRCTIRVTWASRVRSVVR